MSKEAKDYMGPTLAIVALAGFAVATTFLVRKTVKHRRENPSVDSLVKLCSALAELLEKRVIALAG